MSQHFFRRLRTSIWKRWTRLTWTGGFAVQRSGAGIFLLNRRNYVDRQVACFGDYEAAQRNRLMQLAASSACDLFLDVGANFGLYTAAFASRFPAMEIIAFEPDPRNIDQFHATVYLNRLQSRVSLQTFALSDHDGSVPFELYSDASTGQSRVGTAGEGGTVDVPCHKLDSVLELEDRRICIKIDIEGHEPAALKGMEATLRRNQCVLQVESFDANRDGVTGAMTQLGYRLVDSIGDDHYFSNIEILESD